MLASGVRVARESLASRSRVTRELLASRSRASVNLWVDGAVYATTRKQRTAFDESSAASAQELIQAPAQEAVVHGEFEPLDDGIPVVSELPLDDDVPVVASVPLAEPPVASIPPEQVQVVRQLRVGPPVRHRLKEVQGPLRVRNTRCHACAPQVLYSVRR